MSAVILIVLLVPEKTPFFIGTPSSESSSNMQLTKGQFAKIYEVTGYCIYRIIRHLKYR